MRKVGRKKSFIEMLPQITSIGYLSILVDLVEGVIVLSEYISRLGFILLQSPSSRLLAQLLKLFY